MTRCPPPSQIAVATLRGAIELLGGDGSVPYPWPVVLDNAILHASPALHDVDGDGVQASDLICDLYFEKHPCPVAIDACQHQRSLLTLQHRCVRHGVM